MMACVLNRCQVQRALSLSQFQFMITYPLGQQQKKPDALSHRSYLMPKKGDAISNQ
jgi:hypothetical protein